MKKFVILALILVLAISICSCGKSRTDSGVKGVDGKVHNLTFYKYRDVGMADGTYDNDVAEAIQKKFLEDTGYSIKLNTKLYTHAELQTTVDNNWTKKNADMDGVIHYISEDYGCATLRYATETDTVLELKDLVDKYGKNILKYIRLGDDEHTQEMSCYVHCGDSFKMNYLTSVSETNKYGIIIRKDYMEKVKDITGIDPEEYDVLNEGYKSMTISQFDSLLYAMKQNISTLKYSIVGAPWDINYTIAPAFGTDAYNIQIDAKGNYTPAQFSEGIQKYYDKLCDWAKDSIWENESASVSDSMRRGWFVAGQAAVYTGMPTVENLITTARMTEANDSTAEIMLLAPLADDDGNVMGYKKNTNPDGLIIPLKSDDAEMVIRFIDWTYESVENYELCAYGIKGTHWIEGEDRVINGSTYKTWEYPDSKIEEYNSNLPYSGKYLILENINISSRIRGDYNPQEAEWLVKVRKEFANYNSNPIEGIWLGSCPRQYAGEFNKIDGNYVDHIRCYVWSGIYPNQEKPSEALKTYIEDCYRDASGYLGWLNELAKSALQFKKNNFIGG